MSSVEFKDVSKVKTAEEIIEEADLIYEKFKKEKKHRNVRTDNPKDAAVIDEIFDWLQKEHSDFAIAYPIQLRFMCQLNKYHSKALKKYLDYIKYHPWKSQDEYLQAQAKYIMYVAEYTERFTREERQKLLNRIYNDTYKVLKQEQDDFDERLKKTRDEMDQEEILYKQAKRDEMITLLRNKLTAKLAESNQISESSIHEFKLKPEYLQPSGHTDFRSTPINDGSPLSEHFNADGNHY